ncbi:MULTISPECIES: hypothetical protein [Pseudomonas]|uniref:hypothetical protein n=1 Tax=Pseudomonas TaxID=286 RepID=UPI002934EE78|nr:hypothetical protein [Pseudomonas sp. P105]WNZ76660.1 hypothetical protein QOM08_18245 [Pseudomonas sp. P105]
MISEVKVCVSVGGNKETAYLVCDSEKVAITFRRKGEVDKVYMGSNFYKCFASLRQDNLDVTFFCKGSKRNVHPSGMSAQMSLGLKAYELNMGVVPSLDDIVYIFEYDDRDLTNDPAEQERFYKGWIESRMG